MNRRSFITKALAGLTALPLITKLLMPDQIGHVSYDIANGTDVQVFSVYVDGRHIPPSDYVVRGGTIQMIKPSGYANRRPL